MGRAKFFERSGKRISERIIRKFGYKYLLPRISLANWKTRVHPREQALHLESSRLDLLRSASNMVLILATSAESRQTGWSFEIRDGNNEFPVNFVPWTSDNGLIVSYGLHKDALLRRTCESTNPSQNLVLLVYATGIFMIYFTVTSNYFVL